MLLCVEPDGGSRVAADGLGFPNGMVVTPDGGTLGKRRTWAAFGDPPSSADIAEMLGQVSVVPDGICMDVEGAIWVADAIHGRLLRVAEGGRVLEERTADGLNRFACMLGGEDGRILFVCAASTFQEAEAAASHQASILMTRVEVPHAGLP